MRKGLLITGIILLLVGLVSIAYPMFVGTTTSVPALPSAAQPTAPVVGSGTFTLRWSGGTDSTQLFLYQCTDSSCSSFGPLLANPTGASGQFSATLTAGNTYALYETGTPISVPATATLMGLTLLVLIGIVLVVVGGIVLLLAFVGRGRRSAGSMGPPMPAETPSSAPRERTESGDSMIQADPSPVAGTRADRECSYCGAMNEPWITNCRKCQRALASTGQ